MTKLRIVAISDTHLQHGIKVPPGDILLHAGDFTFKGNVREIGEAIQWFKSLPHKYKVCTLGNHDCLGEENPSLTKQMFQEAGIAYLNDSGVLVEGIRIWGSPYQPEFGNWAFNLPREGSKLKEHWSLIPEDTNVLITHGPPLGMGDMTTGKYGPPANVGCRDLNERVMQLPKLKLHVFGHIHCSYGVYRRGDVTYANASVCNERYKPVNKPLIFVAENGKIDIG